MNIAALRDAVGRATGGRRVTRWWWAAAAAALLLLIMSALQGAQPQAPSTLPSGSDLLAPPVSIGSLLAELLLKLGVVVGLIYGSLYLLRRWQVGVGASAQRRLAVLESTRLGPRQALHLVRAGEQVLLVGATDHGISLLAELEATLPVTSAEPAPPFQTALARLLPHPAERRQ